MHADKIQENNVTHTK